MSTNSYTDQNNIVKSIIDIYSNYGSSIDQIAKFLHLKRHQVHYILRKNNILMRNRGRPMCNIDIEYINNLRNNNMPVNKISQIMNCSIVTIYDRINKNRI